MSKFPSDLFFQEGNDNLKETELHINVAADWGVHARVCLAIYLQEG